MSQFSNRYDDDEDYDSDVPWSADAVGGPWWFDSDVVTRASKYVQDMMDYTHCTPDMPMLNIGDTQRVFVYGTLKKNFPNHYLLKKAVFVGRGWTEPSHFMMVETKTFPAVLYNYGEKRAHVFGEIYEVPTSEMHTLDILESNGTLYERRPIEVITDQGEAVRCWWYVGNPACFGPNLPLAQLFTRKKTQEQYFCFTRMK